MDHAAFKDAEGRRATVAAKLAGFVTAVIGEQFGLVASVRELGATNLAEYNEANAAMNAALDATPPAAKGE